MEAGTGASNLRIHSFIRSFAVGRPVRVLLPPQPERQLFLGNSCCLVLERPLLFSNGHGRMAWLLGQLGWVGHSGGSSRACSMLHGRLRNGMESED